MKLSGSHQRGKAILLFLCLCMALWHPPAYGQHLGDSPILRQKKLAPLTQETLASNQIFHIAGNRNDDPDHLYALGGMGKLLLAAATVRLADEGKLTLDEPISRSLPDIIEENPFTVAVTAQHILTETAGFAVPVVINTTVPLGRYATHARSSGQAAHHDPVGWAILIRFLEAKTGTAIDQILKDYVLDPFGLPIESLFIPEGTHPLYLPDAVQGTVPLITALARMVLANQQASGQPYLTPAFYALIAQKPSWRLHPMGPVRTLGLSLHADLYQHWFEALPTPADGAFMIAFPEVKTVFISLESPTPEYRRTVLQTARDQFRLPPTDAAADTAHLRGGDLVSGIYVKSDQPSLWLRDRLQTILQQSVYINIPSPEALLVREEMPGGTLHETAYRQIAPYYYTDKDSNKLTFSTYRSGGYMFMDDSLYHFGGILADPRLVIDPMPVILLLLASSGFYIFWAPTPVWRRMGAFGLAGTVLVVIGVALDYYLWPDAMFHWDMPWLVTLWRIFLNAGLALVLSLPLFTLSFARRNRMPTGVFSVALVPLHLGLISVAAVVLLLILAAWGVTGSF